MNMHTWMISICLFSTISAYAHGADFTPFDQGQLRIFPPPQYDRAYKGKLDIRHVDAEEMKLLCPPNIHGQRIACTKIATSTYCLVYIGPADELEALGYTYETVKGHEIGHCNGWKPDHPGMHALKEGETRESFLARYARWKIFVAAREQKKI